MADNGERVPPPFNRERAIGGSFLIGLVGVLEVIDAFRPDYQLDPFPLFLMLGTGAVLLGVDAVRRIVS